MVCRNCKWRKTGMVVNDLDFHSHCCKAISSQEEHPCSWTSPSFPQEEVSKPRLSLSSQPRHLLYCPVINYCSQKQGDRRVRLLSETLLWLKVFLYLDLESEPPCLHLISHTLMGWTAEWFLKAKKHPLTLRQWWIQMLNSKIAKQAIHMTILLVLTENHTTGSVLLLESSLCKRGACLGLVHTIFYHCLKKMEYPYRIDYGSCYYNQKPIHFL